MNAYRFSIPAEVCFTIEAETEEEARKVSAEAFFQYDEGCDLDVVEPEDERFSKANDVRLYTDANKADNPEHLNLDYVDEVE